MNRCFGRTLFTSCGALACAAAVALAQPVQQPGVAAVAPAVAPLQRESSPPCPPPSVSPDEISPEAPAPVDAHEAALREARGRRYFDAGMPLELSPCGEVVTTMSYPLQPLFPVSASDLVIVGEIASLQTYLTPRHAALYTEFTVQVEEVFKRGRGVEAKDGDAILIERRGGVLRTASGRVLADYPMCDRLPSVGHRYVFFLKRNPQSDFSIVTAYDISDSTVKPLYAMNEPFPDQLAGPQALLEAVRNATRQGRR